MIVEERIYTLYAGAELSDFLRIYETEGLVVQRPILGGFIGYFTSMFGTLNQVVHWWAYSDLNDRERRRALLHQDPAWLAVLPKLRPMLQQMENRILSPVAFSPIRSLPIDVREDHSAFSNRGHGL